MPETPNPAEAKKQLEAMAGQVVGQEIDIDFGQAFSARPSAGRGWRAMQALPGTRLMRSFLPVMLCLGCSISSAQIEPNAGTWKTWVLTSGDQLRLPAPPNEADTRTEVAQLKTIAKQRDAATLERIVWWNAGPPGYRWTSIAIPPGPANATLHSRIMALLSVAIYDATVAAWDAKYAYNRPRPTAFDPSLTAALPNPQSPSYPSEHAVVAGAASTVLAYLFPDKAGEFRARADEAAQVWVQAGLHYPSDVEAGLELGRAVGALVVDWAKRDGSDKTGPAICLRGRADGRELIRLRLLREAGRLGCSLLAASCALGLRRIADLLKGKPNWLSCATIRGPSRAMPARFTGNQAARTGTTLSIKRSSSIGSM